jgi:hypothetical protein
MYLLTRENDNKILQGRTISFIEWNEDDTFHSTHVEPAEGRSLIMDPHPLFYTWMTTEIISFSYEGDILKFSTKNSNYILEQISTK